MEPTQKSLTCEPVETKYKPKYTICNCPSVPWPHQRLVSPSRAALLPPGPKENWGILIDNMETHG
jgi:hypothetical protein